MKQTVAGAQLTKPWLFFMATYGWTWFFWGMAYLMGVSGETEGILGPSLILLGLAGPMVMSMTSLYLNHSKEEQREYWKRIADFKRISFKWWLLILFLMPAITIFAGYLSGHWEHYRFASILPSLGLTIFVTPLVPFLEELGWRGYVLDCLQKRYSALASSLILGTAWALWHLPVFFLKGSVFSLAGVGSLAFWLYFVNLVTLSVLFTWIYNNTERSILSAIIFHTILEIMGHFDFWPAFSSKVVYNSVLLLLVVIGIVIFWGPKRLLVCKDRE